MTDFAWRNSVFGAVYDTLNRSLEPSARNVVPGTDALIARSLNHFRAQRDERATACLEAIALAVLQLQQALRAGLENHYAASRRDLRKLASAWLLDAPMVPGAFPAETAWAMPKRLAA